MSLVPSRAIIDKYDPFCVIVEAALFFVSTHLKKLEMIRDTMITRFDLLPGFGTGFEKSYCTFLCLFSDRVHF